MKYQRLLPMAALGLIVSAFVAQAAPKPAPPIQIYGPETIAITAPGNYILMNEVSTEPIGINILANNVTLNLNGHSSYGNYGIVIWGNNDYVYNGTAVGPYNG